jgi:hypothetical protein
MIGIEHIKGEDYHLFICDPAVCRFELVSTPNLQSVVTTYNQKKPTLAVNAGEWNDRDSSRADYLKPKDYTISNGKIVQFRNLPVPSLMVTDHNRIIVDHRLQTANISQGFSGLRYLMEGGTIKTYLYGTEPQYTEGHARTCFGITKEGKLAIFLSEGVYPNQGWKLWEVAELLKANGVLTAFDGGGGGDTDGMFEGGSLVLTETIVNGVHAHRLLPMTFCVYTGENMATIGHVKGTAKGVVNIKRLADGALLAVMGVGDVVYGEWSTLKTDLINFDHYFKGGQRMELGALCKCVVTNLTVTVETEPAVTPTPVPAPDPVPAPTPKHTIDIVVDGVNVKHIDLP